MVGRLYDFYKLLHGYIVKFPKPDKYTLGQTILSTSLQLIEAVFSCSNSNPIRRKEQLTQASAKLDLLKMLIRLACDIKAIDQKGYVVLQERLQEIGKMIGGWLRSLN